MILTLKQRPDFFPSVLKLASNSFGYDSLHKIEIDFYPLFQEENWEHCFILLDETENLVAHLGLKIRQMIVGDKIFPIALLGGIAVDEQQRGHGHFRTLFSEIIKRFEQQVTFFILWSDKDALYEKFDFFQVGEVFEAIPREQGKTKYPSSTLEVLSLSQLEAQYHSAYETRYACIKRDKEDWLSLQKITSAELLHGKDEYAIRGKGMDLQNIIYEWHNNDWLKTCALDGKTKIWFPTSPDKDFKILRKLFLGLVKIGNTELFQNFFHAIFKRQLNLVIQATSCKIKEHGQKDYSMQAILEMTFSNSSPNKWPIYVSGLDSI